MSKRKPHFCVTQPAIQASAALPSQPRHVEDGLQYFVQHITSLAFLCVHESAALYTVKPYHFAEPRIMDGVSATASIFTVIDISVKIASLFLQYAAAVKDANKNIERLKKKVIDIKRVLKGIKQLLEGRDEALLVTTHKLSNPLRECLRQLEDLEKQLELRKTHKVMGKVGLQALKWPFTSKQVDKIVADLERYEQTFWHALQADQT